MQGHRGHDAQGNAFVGRSEDDVEVQPEGVMDGARIVDSQAVQLISRDVGARVHEERGGAPALEREFAELKDVAFDHELDEFLLVLLHRASFRVGCAARAARRHANRRARFGVYTLMYRASGPFSGDFNAMRVFLRLKRAAILL